MGEATPPQEEGKDPISPSNAVASVSGLNVARSPEDYDSEMAGAQQGELRGFEPEADGSQSYAFDGNGVVDPNSFEEHRENHETIPPEGDGSADAGAVQHSDLPRMAAAPSLGAEGTEREFPGGASPVTGHSVISRAAELPNDLQPQGSNVPRESAAASLGSQSSEDEDLTAGTAKAVTGGVSPGGTGLPIDDDDGGDSSADDSDGSSATPPPLTETSTGTGVRPTYPGFSPASLVEGLTLQAVEAGSVTIAGARELSSDTYRADESLESDEAASDRPPEPQIGDYTTGTDENGDPIFDQEAYDAAVAQYQAALAVWETQQEQSDDSLGEDVEGAAVVETGEDSEAFRTQLEAILESIQSYLKALSDAENRLDQLRDQIHDIDLKIDQLTAELALITDYIREVMQENQHLTSTLDTLAEGDTVSISVQSGGDPASGDYSWSEETIEMDRAQIEARIIENGDLISTLQTRIAALEVEIETLHRNQEDKQDQITDVLEKMGAISDKIQALQDQAAILSKLLGQDYQAVDIPAVDTSATTTIPTSSHSQPVAASADLPQTGGLPDDD